MIILRVCRTCEGGAPGLLKQDGSALPVAPPPLPVCGSVLPSPPVRAASRRRRVSSGRPSDGSAGAANAERPRRMPSCASSAADSLPVTRYGAHIIPARAVRQPLRCCSMTERRQHSAQA